MASLQASNFLAFSSSPSKQIHAAISVPKLPSIRFSVPKVPTKSLPVELNTRDGFVNTIPFEKNVIGSETRPVQESSSVAMATVQLYAILESVVDRVEIHNNVGQQRENWNALLLNSINMITLTAATMAATGMLVMMNKIQPSQLVEEQRNATRLFKQLQGQIETLLAIGSPSKEEVKDAMEKVLALDKAYPLPLLGVMLEKFPESLEPAVWWPKTQSQKTNKKKHSNGKVESNGWTEELELEMRQVVEVIKRKDSEDYERLGNKALKMNKVLAASGPLLTGIAALGSAFMGPSNGPWAAIMTAAAGALASAVNTFEHGGQVGMVFEMYRNNAGFFKLVQESIEWTLSESDLEKRENGELFEMKVALQLGRSVSQLRDLAKKSNYSRLEGSPIDEFASKLF
ncbi:hypothetical protein GOBAR_DD18129 [Gossypium barbadense]|nr:hypothetical protein GOBAR_DD18129 [Gossypium barbadense]